MAGIYKGVQARIPKVNEAAKFIPCSVHSLNLACCPSIFRYDYICWYSSAIFRIFSSSTARWDILTSCLNYTFKRHCDTHWSSKSTAIKAMHDQLLEIKTALEKIFEESLDPETKSTAQSLLKNINY
jgi:hypothetical protein